MQWFEQVVKLVQALAWPVVVLTAVWLLRHRLRDLLDRTGTVKFPGGEWQARADLAAKEENLAEEVEQSAAVLVGETGQAPPSDPAESSNGKPPAEVSTEKPTSPTPDIQREALEDLVQRAAEWGAARGRAGMGVEGTVVRWNKDGPRLVVPSSARNAVATDRGRIQFLAHSTEARIAILERELKFAKEFALDTVEPITTELEDARNRLAKLQRRIRESVN